MYKPQQVEPEILKLWKDNDIYKKAKEANKGNKKFYFLDGPPYTSGSIHIGTAWNKALKDCILRYKRMSGLDVWDRAGYDMHGMPTEVRVEARLKLKNKDEIERYGIDKFIKACKDFSLKNLHKMNEDFMRIGVWMDFENAYQTIKKEYMEGEWWLIKKAHENKRLYEGEKTMHWCPRCATALAKHELEYKNIQDDSIFVKLPIIGKKNEYLLIWTTTPWTMPFNMLVMAHPDFDYVKAKIKSTGEVWILAKALAGSVIKAVAGEEYEILEEFKGQKLKGVRYKHPFYEETKYHQETEKTNKRAYTVVLSEEYVDLSAGTGLVHCAPGCGPEDYEVGYKNKIKPYNTLDEYGVFPEPFKGLKTRRDDKQFTNALKKKGLLIAETKVTHDYAHCWRCKTPVIYRTTRQWFFKVEDLKEKMRKLNQNIYWVPVAAFNAFDSWLENLRDNGITRQRYWGTPLPVWKCEKCQKYVVVGSADELEKLSGKKLDDLHKPGIDEVTIKCECGGVKKKIPDVLDVWVDAGSASWTCLDYPHREDIFKELYPADFIMEGKDQIRGWFNLLFVASMVSMGNASFKKVYMHGFVQDSLGRKMSKSLGNIISPYEVIDKYGADVFRYYSIGGANPGLDLNYNFDDMKTKQRNLLVLWNIHKYLLDLTKSFNINPKEIEKLEIKDLEERYIYSKLNSTILKVTDLFEKYYLNQTPWAVEELFLELSRTYIQLTREKIALGDEKARKTVIKTIYDVLTAILQMFTPTAPFVTEKMYQNLRKEFGLEEESISLMGWPKADKKLIDKKLEKDFETAKSIVQSILSAREKLGLGVRWPLKEVIIVSEDKDVVNSVDNLNKIISTQTNVKNVTIKKHMEKARLKIKVDYNKIKDVDNAPKIIAQLALHSPETILKHIEEEGHFKIKVDKQTFEVKREHLIISREAPGYESSSFKGGSIFLSKEITPELEAEGFAREIMRRTQNLRKKAGLKKADKVHLYIKVDERLKKALTRWEDPIFEKVGAKKMMVKIKPPEEKYIHHSKENVRGKEFEIFLSKA